MPWIRIETEISIARNRIVANRLLRERQDQELAAMEHVSGKINS